MKPHRIIMALIFCALLVVAPALAADTWKPDRPIKLIVPWGAGGSTDQVTRVCAGELEKPLGQTIVVVNQPGASGSIGTKNTIEAPKDGYTWTAGAAKDLGTYQVLGMLNTGIRDWHLFLNISLPQVVAVQADSPYQTFADLLKSFKDSPGKVKVSSAGINSAGHSGIETIKKYTGIDYKHITYDGGNPAVIAVVSGEADVVTQLSSEETDMLKAGKLRALAVLDDTALDIEGYGTVPPITQWIPEFKGAPIYFGIFVPKGVPDAVVDTLGAAWDQVIKQSAKLKQYAAGRGAVFAPSWGDEAQKRAFPKIQEDAWLKWDSGQAKVKPDTVGIPKP
ncbi:MAG: tripartite tricarboxylate transporter substrate binding protein [Desulfobacterales bacterium]|nr:tripartite tricarboxylate transporter substrate binding protein [Desulfobacterales bacterium]